MSQVIETVDVDVPVRTAYDQWTQFESFPEFMSGVESVTQTSDTTTHWVTSIAGVKREFDADITEQHPDERVAWNSTGGEVSHAGVVTFHRLSDTTTRVTIQLDWDPQGLLEKVGAAVGVDDRQIKADAKRFKEFIESHQPLPQPRTHERPHGRLLVLVVPGVVLVVGRDPDPSRYRHVATVEGVVGLRPRPAAFPGGP